MKKNNFLFLLIVATFISVFISSCDSRPRGVLTSKKMEKLMVEIHVLEGSLRASGNAYDRGETSQKYYQALFYKFGITEAEFDSSLVWYTKHPKKFEKIYLNVVASVDTLGADVRKGKYHPVDSAAVSGEMNLWAKATKYVYTKDSARTKLNFKIENVELLPGDYYELHFLHRVGASDSSLNPHAVMYVNYKDNIVDSLYTKTRNDSVLRRYTMIFKARKNMKVESLSGYLLGNDSSKGKMNAYIDSVKLMRKYNPFKQDSIRSVILKSDTVSGAKKIPKDSIKVLPEGSPRKTLKRPKEV